MALTDKLSAIGVAIREKTGKTELLTLDAMPNEILAITTGGGSDDCNGLHMPEEALVLTGYMDYKFYHGCWDWFIEQYGDKITTVKCVGLSNTFSDSKVTSIPFDINYAEGKAGYDTGSRAFSWCKNLREVPKILYFKPGDIDSMFTYCHNLREIPDDYFDTWDWSGMSTATSAYTYGKLASLFEGCYSLRSIPEDLFAQNRINRYMAYSSTIYAKGFYLCYVLDKIKLPVYDKASWTSNAFNSWSMLHRLSSLTFNTNEDGSPIVVTGTWKKQTLDLSSYIGYANNRSNITSENSGITADKEVTDSVSYAALKTDPDWFTCNVAYSRYNHDSAVETINTLPDVSSGSNNTIKFKGDAGSATDGGAINTLTEEEIAVATAKGWTIVYA